MSKLFLCIALAIISGMLLNSCNSCNKKKEPIQTLKIGYIPILDCSQLFVAKELGYFEKHNINVELIPVEGGSKILQALAANEIDVAFSNLASVVFYEQNFDPLQILSGGTLMNHEYTEGGLVVLESSGIKKIEDFKGKIIAVNALNNIVHLAIVRILKKHGLTSKDVSIVEMKFSDMPIALRSKRIDIASLPEPILTMSKQEGGLFDFGDYIVLAFDEVYVTGFFTTKNKQSQNEELFKRYNSAIAEATETLNKYNDSVLNAISKYTKISPEIITSSGKPLFVNEIPDNSITTMKKYLNEESFIK